MLKPEEKMIPKMIPGPEKSGIILPKSLSWEFGQCRFFRKSLILKDKKMKKVLAKTVRFGIIEPSFENK
jgi:hypothetical protein